VLKKSVSGVFPANMLDALIQDTAAHHLAGVHKLGVTYP